MASAEQTCPVTTVVQTGEGLDRNEPQWATPAGSAQSQFAQSQFGCGQMNVGSGERLISVAAGSLLSLLGLARRDKVGLAIAGLGGAMLYRGATGRCRLYEALEVSTVNEQPHGVPGPVGVRTGRGIPAKDGIHLTQSFLINQSPEKLYEYWRRLENLPNFMTHLKSVERIDGNRSHWVAEAPWIVGGQVEWDAEMTADEPASRIAWQSLPGATVAHHGSVSFTRAPADRGTAVRVEMKYLPPGGKVGQWISKVFGDAPEQQIRDDLRNFKRLMEAGEIPTTAGQPRGLCNR